MGLPRAAYFNAGVLLVDTDGFQAADVLARAVAFSAAHADKLLHMEDKLHTRVIGQDEAVRLVSDAIRRSRSGLSLTGCGALVSGQDPCLHVWQRSSSWPRAR